MPLPLVKSSAELEKRLLQDGLVTGEELEIAKRERGAGRSLAKTLVDLGFISEEELSDYLTRMMDIPFIDLKSFEIELAAFRLIPKEYAKKYKMIGIAQLGSTFMVATPDPLNIQAIDVIQDLVKFNIDVAACANFELERMIDTFYELPIDQTLARLGGGEAGGGKREMRIPAAQKTPVTKPVPKLVVPPKSVKTAPAEAALPEESATITMVDHFIKEALQKRASDIHFEPDEENMRVRMRVDGMLHVVAEVSKKEEPGVLSRVKLVSGMDIAEHRAPQDGRFNFSAVGREIDVRASCFPTIHGENIVLRLLDSSSALLSLEELGLSKELLGNYESLLQRSYGMILSTGPTGSGKTTTLYASLNHINAPSRNIITIEDPVEYNLPLIRQSQVNPKAHVTFASGLRSILRQDPDVIMVGEIRDQETAEIAIQAALTGHLVFSTLHTNDAAGACSRLIEMGIEPFLISSSVVCVISQRLVRLLCESCKKAADTMPPLLAPYLGKTIPEGITIFGPVGCSECFNTGYRGRTAIFEVMPMTQKIESKINGKSSSAEIRAIAREEGMKTIFEDGLEKVRKGLTSVEEIITIVGDFAEKKAA